MSPNDNAVTVTTEGAGIMQTEPVAAIGGIGLASITALVVAIFTLSKAFDLYNITDDQQNAILGVLGSFWAVGPLLIIAIRQAVYAPATVNATKQILYDADPATPATRAEVAALTS